MRNKRLVKKAITNFEIKGTVKNGEWNVDHIKPKRYATRTVRGADVIDMAKELNLNFNEASIMKYLVRDKNQDIEDLQKIIVFAKREIEHLESE